MQSLEVAFGYAPVPRQKSVLSVAELQSGCGLAIFWTVDNFVAEKASDFNKVQQTSTSRPQTIQQQSLRINKNP
jgi:hypothetical protein